MLYGYITGFNFSFVARKAYSTVSKTQLIR